MANFVDFYLNEKILKLLTEIGFETPTEIQELAIPKVLEGLDLIASAQTGTGKTAAFMLPALHFLADPSIKVGAPRILVLVPTRELAMQVADETKKFSRYLPHIKTVCIYGGVPYPIQKRSLSRPYDILVATPGRLIDHMEQGRIDLSRIGMLVLDEADRMLDMGFIEPVEHIAAATPKTRQTLLFSATIDKKILPISRKLQKEPHEIRMEKHHSAKANIDQSLYFVDGMEHKMLLLENLLESEEIRQTIIFTSTKNQANTLSRHLCDKGYQSASLHGDMNQSQRTRTIEKMRSGKIRSLVATDVAARGIDITTLTHVINFDLPHNPEDFIHRTGRTGRAGASGIAISFARYSEECWVKKINTLLGKPMEVKTIAGMEPKSRAKKKEGPAFYEKKSSHKAPTRKAKAPFRDQKNGFWNRTKPKSGPKILLNSPKPAKKKRPVVDRETHSFKKFFAS